MISSQPSAQICLIHAACSSSSVVRGDDENEESETSESSPSLLSLPLLPPPLPSGDGGELLLLLPPPLRWLCGQRLGQSQTRPDSSGLREEGEAALVLESGPFPLLGLGLSQSSQCSRSDDTCTLMQQSSAI